MRSKSIPIGRPIANAEIYILDEQLQPTPIGVPGELCIGGRGLARGYLRRPELTAEKFIPHPFRNEPGARLYKTGDLARYLPDGEIEFLGRIDHQVKVRGFRIELGEIESTLKIFPEISETVVVARPAAGRENRLVAYVVSNGTPALIETELRAHLRSKLPDYMVPAAFVFLEALPLTPGGKIARTALPDPEYRPDVLPFIAPRTEMEKELTQIWCDVLGFKEISVRDNFFELGGHSLLAAQIVSRMKRSGCVVALRDLFQAPTIEGLGFIITKNLRAPRLESRPITPLARDGVKRSVPLFTLMFDSLANDFSFFYECPANFLALL